jgi:hypothetical protein
MVAIKGCRGGRGEKGEIGLSALLPYGERAFRMFFKSKNPASVTSFPLNARADFNFPRIYPHLKQFGIHAILLVAI